MSPKCLANCTDNRRAGWHDVCFCLEKNCKLEAKHKLQVELVIEAKLVIPEALTNLMQVATWVTRRTWDMADSHSVRGISIPSTKGQGPFIAAPIIIQQYYFLRPELPITPKMYQMGQISKQSCSDPHLC